MAKYAIKRILISIPILLTVVTLVFFLVRSMPGGPAIAVLGDYASKEAVEALEKEMGLDIPIWQQYLIYIGNIFHGDLGKSYLDGRDAIEVVMERVPKTLSLMWITAIVTFLIGIPAGIYSALHHNTAMDRFAMTLSVMGLSIPNFFLGVLLILLFSVTWRLLPSAGSETWQHYIMPVVTMATAEAAIFARFMRSSMLEVLSQPYIRTAIAKGVPWRKVVRGHALPNAAIPTVTVAGFFVGSLIVGGVITENVFAWPGVGRLLVDSVANRDLAVVQVAILLIAVSMVSANLIVDLSYGWLDPRVRDLQTKE